MEITIKDIDISRKIDVNVHLDDVIDAINELDIHKRWNYVAKVLNEIDNNALSELTDDQKGIIERYLWRKSDEIKQSRKL